MDLNPTANNDNRSSPPALGPSSPTSITTAPAAPRKTTRTTRPKQPMKKRTKKCTIYKPEDTGLLLEIMNKLVKSAVIHRDCELNVSHIEHVNIKIRELRKKAADKYGIYDVKPFFSTPEFSKGNFELISNQTIRHQVAECIFCERAGECYRRIPKKDHNRVLLQLLRGLVDDAVSFQEGLSTSRPDHVDIRVDDLQRMAIIYENIDLYTSLLSPEFSEANFELTSDWKVIRHRLPTVEECCLRDASLSP